MTAVYKFASNGFTIESTALEPDYIQKLINKSKEKAQATHLGNAYKHINIYKVTPKGVCVKVNNKVCIIQKAAWSSFPPPQEEILDAVDYLCTDSGKGGSCTNYDVKFYPTIVEYFKYSGLKYTTLEIIPTPDELECVCLTISYKGLNHIAKAGNYYTHLKGDPIELDKIRDYVLKSGYGRAIVGDKNATEYRLYTPFCSSTKIRAQKLHHTILDKIARGEIRASIVHFMKFADINQEQIDKIADINLEENPSSKYSRDEIIRFITSDTWTQTILIDTLLRKRREEAIEAAIAADTAFEKENT